MRNTYLWILHLATGALLALFLGIHMVMMHLEDILHLFGISIEDPVGWSSMIERAREEFWLVFSILLLAFVLYHGLNGLRGILLELSPSPPLNRIINVGVLALGIIMFAWGTYVPIRLFLG